MENSVLESSYPRINGDGVGQILRINSDAIGCILRINSDAVVP